MFHLTPKEIWIGQIGRVDYRPEPFDDEGFIHCTIGEENLIAVGNRYYTSDLRDMVCLVIDPLLVAPEIRTDDSGGIFPHIHGPLNLDAVIGVRAVVRDPNGTFQSVGGEIA